MSPFRCWRRLLRLSVRRRVISAFVFRITLHAIAMARLMGLHRFDNATVVIGEACNERNI